MKSPTTYLVVALYLLFFTSYGFTTDLNCSDSNITLECQIQQMNFKLARLELLIERTDQELYTKRLHIGKCEERIEELSHTILHLESILSNLKDAPDYEEMVKVFEEQVRELEADVRRNDLDLHLLEVRAKDGENSVKRRASQLEMMAKVVPELWFHVQKLEQAREVIERRTIELRRHLRNQKCSFFKFINKFPGSHYQKMVVPYTSEAMNQITRSCLAIKKYHHQLQGFVKQEMERNKFTSVLASEELVFFLVSAVVVFPLILALRWLLSVVFLASSVAVFPFIIALRLLSSIPFLASAVVVISVMLALR